MYSDATYQHTLTLALDKLADLDREWLEREKGVRLEDSAVLLPYIGVSYAIDRKSGTFEPSDLPVYERILLVHYLITCNDFASRGQLVGFKNLPGVSFYEPTYRKRATDRIARSYGADASALVAAGERMGGAPAGLGDASVRILVFPRVAATVVIHAGDDEFPAEASILYDDTIGIHLPTEDVAVLGGVLATRLKSAGSPPSVPPSPA